MICGCFQRPELLLCRTPVDEENHAPGQAHPCANHDAETQQDRRLGIEPAEYLKSNGSQDEQRTDSTDRPGAKPQCRAFVG